MPTTESAPPFEIKRDANYAVDEAAAWLRRERQYVYKQIKNGRLAAKRDGLRSPFIIPGAALLDFRDNMPDA